MNPYEPKDVIYGRDPIETINELADKLYLVQYDLRVERVNIENVRNERDKLEARNKLLEKGQETIDNLVEALEGTLLFIEDKHPNMNEPTAYWIMTVQELIKNVKEKE